MTAYILFYFSFGVALAIFIEHWANNPESRVFMSLFSLCVATAAALHYTYDERVLERKIIKTLDAFIDKSAKREDLYDLEQIPEVVPGKPIGDK